MGVKPHFLKAAIRRSSPFETITRCSSSITTFMLIQREQLYIGCVSGMSGSGQTRMSQPAFSNRSGTLAQRVGCTSSLPGASGEKVAAMPLDAEAVAAARLGDEQVAAALDGVGRVEQRLVVCEDRALLLALFHGLEAGLVAGVGELGARGGDPARPAAEGMRSGGTGWDWLALTGTGRPPVECVSIAFCGFSPNCRKLLGEADVPGAYACLLYTSPSPR